jgi:hypothetical protein
MMKRLLAFALALCAIAPAPALAQDVWGWSVITPTDTGTDQLSQHLRSQMQRQDQRRATRTTRAIPTQREMLDAAPDAPAPNLAALRYTPSKARRTANLAKFVEKTRKVDAAHARDLQNLFAQGDFIEKIGGVLAPHRLRVDNVADAYAVWWIAAWQATRGTNDTAPDSVMAAVRAQSARALGSTPELVNASDADKQEMAESLLVQSALIDRAVDQSKGNASRLRDLGIAVNKGAQGMGLDLTTMELTENGFVLGSAASIAGEQDKLASATTTAPSSSGSVADYGILAVAGVAVGGALWWRWRG